MGVDFADRVVAQALISWAVASVTRECAGWLSLPCLQRCRTWMVDFRHLKIVALVISLEWLRLS